MEEYPLAHGFVHITHADDVSAPPDFVPGYFKSCAPLPSLSIFQPHSDSITSIADVRPLMWGYKFQREITHRMPHFRGEPPVLHAAFPPGGLVSVIKHANGPICSIHHASCILRKTNVFSRSSCMLGVCSLFPSTSILLICSFLGAVATS